MNAKERDTTSQSKTFQEQYKEREESKARKRKWKEDKLIKKLKKEKVKSELEESKAKAEEAVQGRQYTVSIALPGSILNNAQSPQLETYLVGQIARAVTVFNIDEVIVFDETGSMTKNEDKILDQTDKHTLCCVKMARILQYLECPQYLRKLLFPHHKDLQFAGLANPLDAPHHMRQDDETEFREGVVVDKPVGDGKGSYVNVGLRQDVQIDVRLNTLSRVTVHMKRPAANGKKWKGCAVAPSYPRTHRGLYWGYEVRLASSLNRVITDCPYPDGGYDVVVGTSERGQSIDQFKLSSFKHLLIVFGGLKGLEASVDMDPELKVSDAREVFHHYLNTCPTQGSRTIRTEEAILITMSALRPVITSSQSA